MENSLKLIVGWKISPMPHYRGFTIVQRYHVVHSTSDISNALYQLTTTKLAMLYAPFEPLHLKLSSSGCYCCYATKQ